MVSERRESGDSRNWEGFGFVARHNTERRAGTAQPPPEISSRVSATKGAGWARKFTWVFVLVDDKNPTVSGDHFDLRMIILMDTTLKNKIKANTPRKDYQYSSHAYGKESRILLEA
jgi:hypothetical protein